MAYIAAEKSERRERAGIARHEHAPHAQLLCNLCRMDRACPAEGHKRMAREVDTFFRGLDANGIHDAGVDDANDARSGLLCIDSHWCCDLLLDCGASGSKVELHFPPEKKLRIERAAQDVRVGDGRLPATLAVADRAGISARARGADFEKSGTQNPPAWNP